MSMGYAAGRVDVVDVDSFKGKVKKAFQLLEKELKRLEVDIDDLANNIEYDDNVVDLGQGGQEAEAKYKQFCRVFNEETGLVIGLGFHDSDNGGDDYDEVDGGYWWVSGLYMETPACKKAKKNGMKFDNVGFVQYG